MNSKLIKILVPVVIIVFLIGFIYVRFFDNFFGAKPHVFLISIDTLRPDHLGAYGYGNG